MRRLNYEVALDDVVDTERVDDEVFHVDGCEETLTVVQDTEGVDDGVAHRGTYDSEGLLKDDLVLDNGVTTLDGLPRFVLVVVR